MKTSENESTTVGYDQLLDEAIADQCIWGDMNNFDPNNSDHRGHLRAILTSYQVRLSTKGILNKETTAAGVHLLQQKMPPNVDVLDIVTTLCQQYATELNDHPELQDRIAMTPKNYSDQAAFWRSLKE